MHDNIYADDVFVTGSNGLVGSNFCKYFKDKYAFITPEIDSLDITNFDALDDYFCCMKLKAIINFAALTDVDGAEKEKGNRKGAFWKVNVIGAKNLARLAKKMGALFIQISTDFVFPGNESDPGPYSEDSSVANNDNSIGWYGWTKRVAEEEIQKVGLLAIVRISFPFGDKTSPKDYLNKIKSGIEKRYPMFNDQGVTPTFMPDLFLTLENIFNNKLTGIYHVATEPITTPYEIGQLLVKKMKTKEKVKQGSINFFLKRTDIAPRPIRGGLLCKKPRKN